MAFTKQLRKAGIRQYIFGDFDGDGVKNIDDPKPFDKTVSKFPNPKKNPRFYHKARMGGTEVKMSDAIRDIERRNNQHRPILNRFLGRNKDSFGRIKTVPSTINKLEKRHGAEITDRAGASVLTENRKQAFQKSRQIKQRNRTNPKLFDDYYTNPQGSHHAIHIAIVGRKHTTMEVQVKSRKMHKLDNRAHREFKKGKNPIKLIKKGRSLFKLGF